VIFDNAVDEERNRVMVGYDGSRIYVRMFDANLEGKFTEYSYPARLKRARMEPHIAASYQHSGFNARSARRCQSDSARRRTDHVQAMRRGWPVPSRNPRRSSAEDDMLMLEDPPDPNFV